MGDIDKIIDKKVVDDHLKRLFDQYKTNTKIFSATHIGHISVSLVFLFSILFPFLWLQIETRENDFEIQQLSQSVLLQEQRIATYQEALSGLKKFFEVVENAPKPLQTYILSLEIEAAGGPKAEYPEGMAATPDSCGPSENKDTWMACRIDHYMTDRFVQNRKTLAEEVAAPLKKMNINEFDGWQADLQTGMQNLLEQSQSKMSSDPTFWKDFNEDSPIYRSMVEGAQRFWVSHQFEAIGQRMAQETESRRSDVDQLNKNKEDIKKRKDELLNSLKNIKTRFGKIGMELDEAILVAPIVFSLLFVLTVSNLKGSIRLRKSFQAMTVQFKDPQKVAITDGEIALTMPLWIDPMDPPIKRKLRAFILMVPVIVAVMTLIIIFYCLKIPGAFPGLSVFDYWKYFFYYLLSTGLFLYGFREIQKAVKGYNVPPVVVDKVADKD